MKKRNKKERNNRKIWRIIRNEIQKEIKEDYKMDSIRTKEEMFLLQKGVKKYSAGV